MEQKKLKKETGASELKIEFKALRDTLIEAGKITQAKFEKFVILKEPQYDTPEKKQRINEVYYGRSSSFYLFLLLQEYAKVF